MVYSLEKNQTTRGGYPMSADSRADLDVSLPEALSADSMSIAVIGPDDKLRNAVVSALAACHRGEIRQFGSYPPSLDDLPRLLQQRHDILLIEWDTHPEYALDLVEGIGAGGRSTVMVYSRQIDPDSSDPELLMRCMRAGAREFLCMPFHQNTIAEALVRAAARRPVPTVPKKEGGRLLVFCGSKGGAGVTAIACNFAVAIAQESSESTLLIDLDLPLGDAALNLGITPGYSTIDALQNFTRLDANFLSKLLVRHGSGLHVLAAPGNYSIFQSSNEAIEKLLSIARATYRNVVVDVGSKLDITGPDSPFRHASTIYLVTQSGIPELRNANRLISQNVNSEGPNLDVVLNRYESRGMRVSDDDIKKALTKSAKWKIPNDYAAMSRMHDTAIPVTSTDSSIARQFSSMARSVCGLPDIPEKKKSLGFLGFIRGGSSKSAPPPEPLRIAPPVSQSVFNSPVVALGSDRSEHARMPERPSQSAWADSPANPIVPVQSEAPVPAEIPARPEALQPDDLAKPEGLVRPEGMTFVEGLSRLEMDKESADLIEIPDIRRDSPGPRWNELERETPSTYSEIAGQDFEQEALPEQETFREQDTFREMEALHSLEYLGQQVLFPEQETKFAYEPLEKAAPPAQFVEPETRLFDSDSYAKRLDGPWFPQGEELKKPPSIESPAEVAELQDPVRTVHPEEPVEVQNPIEPEPPIEVAKSMEAVEPAEAEQPVWTAQAEVAAEDVIAESPILVEPPAMPDQAPAMAAPTVIEEPERPEVPAFVALPATLEQPVIADRLEVNEEPEDKEQPAAIVQAVEAAAIEQPVVEKAVVQWATPDPITYGTPLNETVFDATASVPGTFVYIPSSGYVLPVGTHTLWVTFVPASGGAAAAVQACVSLVVNKATPVISWMAPAPVIAGTPLGSAQLNADASVPGVFTYSPAEGDVLPHGTHELKLTFTPADSQNYTTAQARMPLQATSLPSTIHWPTPSAIPYGTPLGPAQFNAEASGPGALDYRPGIGTILPVGRHTLSVTYAPSSTSGYAPAQSEVILTVTKDRPAINWPTPAPIVYGTPLGATELNATASVPGTFAYVPGDGAILSAGRHTPTAIFTPADTANYTSTQIAVSLSVLKATPKVEWPAPRDIPYGTLLSSSELSATSSVPGTFTYEPEAGRLLEAGVQKLGVTFVPIDAANYTTTEASVSLNVTSAAPARIDWPEPAAIVFGAPLGAAQLNATAAMAGNFVYSPAEGNVLPAGVHTLAVTFTPADPHFPPAEHTVELTVLKATPEIDWRTPEAISFGTALDSEQLNATASVEGTFAYLPRRGEIPGVGRQMLTAVFTPQDNANYASERAEVWLTVTKATPLVSWVDPKAIVYGTPLSAAELCAEASVPGAFFYAPAKGTVLSAGVQTLTVTFVPSGPDYGMVHSSVSLLVKELSNIDVLLPASKPANVEPPRPVSQWSAVTAVAQNRWVEETVVAPSPLAAMPPLAAEPLRRTQAEMPNRVDAPREPVKEESLPASEIKLETRTYKGITYVKGADDEWHVLSE